MSEKLKLNQLDRASIGKGAMIAMGGTAFTYFQTEIFPNIDWGTYAPIAVAVNSVLINLVRKWLSGPTK